MLHHRTRNTHHVCFLERICANEISGHLTRDNHHGNTVHIGGRDTGYGIGRSGTGGNQHNTGITRRARIAIGHMGRRLFVTHQNMLDFLLTKNRVIDVQGGPSGVPEDVFHTLVLQRSD